MRERERERERGEKLGRGSRCSREEQEQEMRKVTPILEALRYLAGHVNQKLQTARHDSTKEMQPIKVPWHPFVQNPALNG